MNRRRSPETRRGAPPVSPRDQVLADWRGLHLAPLEAMQSGTVRSAADTLPHVLRRLGLDRRRSEAEIARVWNHLIDPNITAHARPTGIRNGTLFVTVDSHVWLDEIVRYRRREILDRLQHSFGRDLITRISFRVG